MAVDFSTKATDVNSQIEPGARVLEPVSRAGEIDALDNIARGVGVASKTIGTIFRNQGKLNESKFLADFSVKLNTLQDAADQGLSSSEVRMRARNMLTEALVNNPDAEEKTHQRYQAFLQESGVGKTSPVSVQRQLIAEAQISAAVDNGFLSASEVGDPVAQDRAIAELEEFQTSVRQLEMSTKAATNATTRLGLTEKQKAVAKAKAEDDVIHSLAVVGQKALPYWKTQYEKIKTAAAQATSEQERQEIIKNGILQLDQDFAQQTMSMAGDGTATNQAKLDQVLQPQKNLLEAYKKELMGEYDLESLKRSVDSAKTQAEMTAWQGLDSEQRQWVAMSNISKAAGDVLAGPMANVAVKLFSKNAIAADTAATSPTNRTKPADVLPSGDEETRGVTGYLDSMETLIERHNRGQVDEATQAEISAQMVGILRGVDVYGNSVESAKEFQPIIDFFSNPEVGKYMEKTGGIPPEITGKVQRVMRDGYATQVIPLLKRDYGKTIGNQVAVRDANNNTVNMTYGDLTDPVMENGRFSFKLKPEYADNFAAKAAIRTANNSPFVKVLNKMIISNAHIQGNTDYQKSFDEIAPEVFEGAGEAPFNEPDEKVEAPTESGLSLDGLVQLAAADEDLAGVSASTLKADVAEIAKAIDIGESGGTGDYSTLLGYTNQEGKKFSDVEITEKTVDELIDFSSADGDYGDYSKRTVGKVATPMGRYQIVGKTLQGLKDQMGLTGDEKFTPELQDKMFLTLMKGRGYDKYKRGEITKDEFMSNMTKEWAGLKNSEEAFAALDRGLDRGGNLQLASLSDSGNEVAIREALDNRDRQAGVEIETDNVRGYEPDITNLQPKLAAKVVELQNAFGKPIPVISGYRDKKRNRKAGGASKSQHIHGNAVDLDVTGLSRSERVALIKQARAMGFMGVGVYANSLHFDLGGKRAWGPNFHKESIPKWAMAALGD